MFFDVNRILICRYAAGGRMKIGEMDQILLTKLPGGHYETRGGLLMQQAGRIPRRRERLEAGGVTSGTESADAKSAGQIPVIFPLRLEGPRVQFN